MAACTADDKSEDDDRDRTSQISHSVAQPAAGSTRWQQNETDEEERQRKECDVTGACARRVVLDRSQAGALDNRREDALGEASIGRVEAFEDDEPDDERRSQKDQEASQHVPSALDARQRGAQLHEETDGEYRVEKPTLRRNQGEDLSASRKEREQDRQT
jgi:hypothetical protein